MSQSENLEEQKQDIDPQIELPQNSQIQPSIEQEDEMVTNSVPDQQAEDEQESVQHTPEVQEQPQSEENTISNTQQPDDVNIKQNNPHVHFNPLFGVQQTRKQSIDDYNQRIQNYHIQQIQLAKQKFIQNQTNTLDQKTPKQPIRPSKSLVLTLQNPVQIHQLNIKRAQNIAKRNEFNNIKTAPINPNSIPEKLQTVKIQLEKVNRELVATEQKQLKQVSETGEIQRVDVIFDQNHRAYVKNAQNAGKSSEIQIVNSNGEIETLQVVCLNDENWSKLTQNAAQNALFETQINGKKTVPIELKTVRITSAEGEISVIDAVQDKNGVIWVCDDTCESKTIQIVDSAGLVENVTVCCVKRADFEKLSIQAENNQVHRAKIEEFQVENGVGKVIKIDKGMENQNIADIREENITRYKNNSNISQVLHLKKKSLDEIEAENQIQIQIEKEKQQAANLKTLEKQQIEEKNSNLTQKRLLNQIQREEDLLEKARKLQREINQKYIENKVQKAQVKAHRQELVNRRTALKKQRKREYELQVQNDMLLSEVREHNAHERTKLADRELMVRIGVVK